MAWGQGLPAPVNATSQPEKVNTEPTARTHDGTELWTVGDLMEFFFQDSLMAAEAFKDKTAVIVGYIKKVDKGYFVKNDEEKSGIEKTKVYLRDNHSSFWAFIADEKEFNPANFEVDKSAQLLCQDINSFGPLTLQGKCQVLVVGEAVNGKFEPDFVSKELGDIIGQ